jgi:hypothetical protein
MLRISIIGWEQICFSFPLAFFVLSSLAAFFFGGLLELFAFLLVLFSEGFFWVVGVVGWVVSVKERPFQSHKVVHTRQKTRHLEPYTVSLETCVSTIAARVGVQNLV